MDMKKDQLQWFTSFLTKNLEVVVLNLCEINNFQMNFINQLLEKFDIKSLEKKKVLFFICITIIYGFQSILDSSKKLWVNPGSELYNNSFEKWLKDNE